MRTPISATIVCHADADGCDQLELWAKSYGIDVTSKSGDTDHVELTFDGRTVSVDYSFMRAFLIGVRWAQFGVID